MDEQDEAHCPCGADGVLVVGQTEFYPHDEWATAFIGDDTAYDLFDCIFHKVVCAEHVDAYLRVVLRDDVEICATCLRPAQFVVTYKSRGPARGGVCQRCLDAIEKRDPEGMEALRGRITLTPVADW